MIQGELDVKTLQEYHGETGKKEAACPELVEG
jgi:hypothetical protein